MIQVNETMNTSYVKAISLVVALANKIIDELDFEEVINKNITWDRDHWGISPGKLAKTLVLSTFTDMRIPLTHIQDRLSEMDLRYLIGEEAMEHNINAFNMGRALERIGAADVNKPYETMVLSAMYKYDITTKRIHNDTTTISFHGVYDIEKMNLTEKERAEVLQIEKGYNKDGRAGDCQIVMGQMVGEHGIPLVSRALNGATSDTDWNKQALDYFDKLRNEGFGDCIYVADSKLVNQELVERMNNPESRIAFLSRCPANFDNRLTRKMVGRAYATNKWTEIGELSKSKKASRYCGISFIENVYGIPMRLLVLESSTLHAKAEQSLERAKDNLSKLVKALEKKEFACRADAEKEYSSFIKMKELRLFSIKAEIIHLTKEKWPPGRRGASTKPILTETYRIKATDIAFDEEKRKELIQNESTFVLISNVTDDTTTDGELLKLYKGQHVVETSFRHLKDPSLASVIYLKNPKRIEALTMLLNFSLLIRAIIQYRMRSGLKKHLAEKPDVPIYAGWAGRPLVAPTYKLFYEHSINCRYEHVQRGEYRFVWPNIEIKELILPLLELMELTPTSILQ